MKKRILTLNDLSKKTLIEILKAVQIRPITQIVLAKILVGEKAISAEKHYKLSVKYSKNGHKRKGKAAHELYKKADKELRSAERLVNQIERLEKRFPDLKRKNNAENNF